MTSQTEQNLRIEVNADAPKDERRYVLTRNKMGRPIIEPLKQERGYYFAAVVDVVLKDRFGLWSKSVKAGIRRELPNLADASPAA